MAWYWWLIIGIAVVVLIPLKLKVLRSMLKKSQKKESDYDE